MIEERVLLTVRDVAELIGVDSRTICTYLSESRPGRSPSGRPFRYASHPFPPPDGRIGRAPWWKVERAPDVQAWAEARPGQGVGGGPKAQRP